MRGMMIDNLIHETRTYHENLFFLDGSKVPTAFEIVNYSKNGMSAVVRTPRGKTPRVYTRERLDQINAEQAAREQAKRLAVERKANESLQDMANTIPEFKMAMVQAKMIVSSKGQGNAKDIQALRNKRFTIGDLLDKPFWTEKKARFLISLVNDYNALAGRMREQVADEEEIRANPANWLRDGRQVITGTVKHIKQSFTEWGEQHKALIILDNGSKLWGSIPSRQWDMIQKDMRVQFNGTVKVSDEDKIFGFFSRPSKMEVIDNEQ